MTIEERFGPRAVESTSAASPSGATLRLIDELCRELEDNDIRYCHWKSNEGLDRSASGDNDLDLLVARADARAFEGVLRGLGFRDAQPPRRKQLPGVYHSYALDHDSGRMVHIHAHYQLVVGDDMTKNYRLPIEGPYLASAVIQEPYPFRVPSPEFELGVFLIRMVLKHSSWDGIVSGQGSLSASERRELDDLLVRVDLEDVWTLMDRHLPNVSREVMERCLRAVRPGASAAFKIATARRLQRELATTARRTQAVDTTLKMTRRATIVLRRKVFRLGPDRTRLTAGGALIAIVGGDGAGKSTAVDDLTRWLHAELETVSVHLGKPPRSLLSRLTKGAMTVAAAVKRSPTSSASALKDSLESKGAAMTPRSRARLVWVVLTARDRYRAYVRARRLASNGALVVCDRFPLREITLMDGTATAAIDDDGRWSASSRFLASVERRYYARITYPDILLVLRVDPDLAVERKRGEQPESYLRPRSEEIWAIDWSATPAVVIDASRPKDDVLREIRSTVWSRL
jgi:thymidylate kinase